HGLPARFAKRWSCRLFFWLHTKVPQSVPKQQNRPVPPAAMREGLRLPQMDCVPRYAGMHEWPTGARPQKNLDSPAPTAAIRGPVVAGVIKTVDVIRIAPPAIQCPLNTRVLKGSTIAWSLKIRAWTNPRASTA